VPAYPDVLEKRPLNRCLSVCLPSEVFVGASGPVTLASGALEIGLLLLLLLL